MKTSLPVALVCLFALLTTSCQKFIEKKKEQAAMEFITANQWYVEQFLEGNIDVTSEFSGFVFYFHDDYSVTGTRDTEVYTGTWQPDIATISITSLFLAAPASVTRLNGTWKLKDSSREFVKAEMPGTNGKNVLRLRKKE